MARAILSRLAGAAVSLHRATLTVDRIHFDRFLDLKARGAPILFALWHGRMFLSIQAHRREGIVTMASQSKDGEIIAGWLERNGYLVVRGSTTRGGSQALREMVRYVRSGRNAALTVDGPKGPPRVVAPGVVQLATHVRRVRIQLRRTVERDGSDAVSDVEQNLAIGHGAAPYARRRRASNPRGSSRRRGRRRSACEAPTIRRAKVATPHSAPNRSGDVAPASATDVTSCVYPRSAASRCGSSAA